MSRKATTGTAKVVSRAPEPELAEAWFARAGQLLARPVDGPVRQVRLHEAAANVWWAHFESLDEEDADDPKRVRALERAGWHLAEATRLAEGCGDVQQAELLKGDALERALLASVHSPAGEQVWNRRARARIERTLARGDLQQALLDLDAGADVVEQFDADERDLEALLDGLAGLLARAVSEAEARGEPWWVGPYGDLETRLKSGAG